MATTKTNEERIADLEAALASIPMRGKQAKACEQDLVKHALQFARLKTHGMSVDDEGRRCLHNKPDADDLAEFYARLMQSDALAILRELSIEEPVK